MQITKTAKLKIINHTKIFDDTIDIYNKALSFYIGVINKEWNNLEQFTSSKDKLNYIESITHITKKHTNIKYSFDKEFYKFPSYLRRACIMEAIGVLSSHKTRVIQWKEDREKTLSKGRKFYKKESILNLNPNSFPIFYKSNMFKKIEDGKALIKIYKDNDWKWIEIKYSTKNLKSGQNYRFYGYKEQNPMLVKSGKKYFLHIPYTANIKLNSTPLKDRKVIGVDLGLTNSAVCSCIDFNGTVIDRLFINQSVEKDRLNHQLHKLSKAKRASGILNPKPNYWRKINNLQNSITQDTADKIIKFALKHNADVIVFEYLEKMKIPKDFYGAKRLRAKLQYWAKRKIQNITITKAKSLGIRHSKVLARGTSMYAFDGSGLVKRLGKRDLAKFKNNKIYHADLSASYNIASRYFIKEILKPFSEIKKRLGKWGLQEDC